MAPTFLPLDNSYLVGPVSSGGKNEHNKSFLLLEQSGDYVTLVGSEHL